MSEVKKCECEHKHSATSNTKECFTTFRGCKILGILFQALPLNRRDISNHTKTIVFECGWGLTLSDNGSYWTECPSDVDRAIRNIISDLRDAPEDFGNMLEMAGGLK